MTDWRRNLRLVSTGLLLLVAMKLVSAAPRPLSLEERVQKLNHKLDQLAVETADAMEWNVALQEANRRTANWKRRPKFFGRDGAIRPVPQPVEGQHVYSPNFESIKPSSDFESRGLEGVSPDPRWERQQVILREWGETYRDASPELVGERTERLYTSLFLFARRQR